VCKQAAAANLWIRGVWRRTPLHLAGPPRCAPIRSVGGLLAWRPLVPGVQAADGQQVEQANAARCQAFTQPPAAPGEWIASSQDAWSSSTPHGCSMPISTPNCTCYGYAGSTGVHGVAPTTTRPKLLVCHDMAGGYGDDRCGGSVGTPLTRQHHAMLLHQVSSMVLVVTVGTMRALHTHTHRNSAVMRSWVQGCSKPDAFRLWRWERVDVFCYFSHHLVTIPPPAWLAAARTHDAQVRGEQWWSPLSA
jgi:hypothetical protein